MTLYEPDATNLNGVIQTWNSEGIVLQKMSVSSSPFVTNYGPEQVLNTENTYFHTDSYILDPYIKLFLLFDCLEIHSYTIKTRHNIDKYHKAFALRINTFDKTFIKQSLWKLRILNTLALP